MSKWGRTIFPVSLNASVLIFAIIAVYLQANHVETINSFCREDKFVECATALFYFLASGLFLYVCKQYRFRNIWCWGYLVMFFLVAAEEISWGQRIFGFDTPAELREINVQEEFTFHNIIGIHTNVRLVGLLVIFVMCFVLPVTNTFLTKAQTFYQQLKLPVCPLWVTSIAIIAAAFMGYPRFVLNRIIQNMDEIGEFLLGLALLAFALTEFMRVRHQRKMESDKVESPTA